MVWFDWAVLRLNYDGRGDELGEFQKEDQILVVLRNGEFYTTSIDLSNHYEDNILAIEKYNSNKIWTAAIYDADQKARYLKRFLLEASPRKQNFTGENPDSRLHLLTNEVFPRIEVVFGGKDAAREPLIIDAEEFIAVKSFKAKGKRISTYEIETVNELEPVRYPDPSEENADANTNNTLFPNESDSDQGDNPADEQEISHSALIDEITGQMNLFDD
jgi:topoisomerase-4 subunit A